MKVVSFSLPLASCLCFYLSLLATANAFTLISDGTWTGALPPFPPSERNSLFATNSQFSGIDFQLLNMDTVVIENTVIDQSTMTIVMADDVDSTDSTVDAARQFRFNDVAFTFNGAPANTAAPQTLSLDLRGFATPLGVNRTSWASTNRVQNTQFSAVVIGQGVCSPSYVYQTYDRTLLTTNDEACHDVGLLLLTDAPLSTAPYTADAVGQLLIAAYNTGATVPACTWQVASEEYVITRLNSISADVVPANPTSADVVIRDGVNPDILIDSKATDLCTFVATGEPQTIHAGRYVTSSASLNPLTQLVEVVVEVEDYSPTESITLWTVVNDTVPVCVSRGSLDDADRFQAGQRAAVDDGGVWSIPDPATATRLVGGVSINVLRFTGAFPANTACGTQADGRTNLQFKVRVEEQSHGAVADYVVSESEFSYNFFYTLNSVVTQSISSRAASLFVVHTLPTTFIPSAGADPATLSVNLQMCTHSEGSYVNLLRVNTGSGLADTYTVDVFDGDTPVPACTPSSTIDEIGHTCALSVTATIADTTCIASADSPLSDPRKYCCQNVAITFDSHPQVFVSTPSIPLTTVHSTDLSTPIEAAPVAVLLDWYAAQTFAENPDIAVDTTVLDITAVNNQEFVHVLDNSLNVPADSLRGGSQVLLRFEVTGQDYTTENWNQYAIEVGRLVICARENNQENIPSYEYGNQYSSGCAVLSQLGAMVSEVYIDAQDAACNVDKSADGVSPATGTSYCPSTPNTKYCTQSSPCDRQARQTRHHSAVGRNSPDSSVCAITGRAFEGSFPFPSVSRDTCESQYGTPTTDGAYDDVGLLNIDVADEWSNQYCRDVNTPTSVATCDAGSAASACASGDTCEPIKSVAFASFVLPDIVFGNTPATLNVNADVFVYRKVSDSESGLGARRRRLLQLGQGDGANGRSNVRAITRRKSVSVVPRDGKHVVIKDSDIANGKVRWTQGLPVVPRDTIGFNGNANNIKPQAASTSSSSSASSQDNNTNPFARYNNSEKWALSAGVVALVAAVALVAVVIRNRVRAARRKASSVEMASLVVPAVLEERHPASTASDEVRLDVA